MKKQFIYLVVLGFVLTLTSCHKEKVDPPAQDEVPVFKATGTIGTEAFDVEAGEDGFYMSTFSEMDHGVQYFAGNLSGGNFQLELGLFNGNIDLPGAALDQYLPQNVSFACLTPQPLLQLTKYQFPNNANIQGIKWYINGVFSGQNVANINDPGKYNVCAVVTFMDGSQGEVCNEMIIGYQKHASCMLRHFVAPNGELQAWVDEGDVPVSSIKWFLDGQHTNDGPKLITTLSPDIHTIKAEITYSNGVKRIKSVLADGEAEGRFLDDFSIFENTGSSVFRDYNAVIEFDKDGKHYSSVSTGNSGASLQVTDISYYGKNDTGKNVFKISATISCNLKESASGQVFPFTCSTVFGVQVD